MKVALVSDTHDNLKAVDLLVRLLNEKGIKVVLHAGDMIAPFTLKKFKGFELYFVYGNNDGERAGLSRVADQLGFEAMGDFGDIVVGGRRFAVMHGTNETLVRAVAESNMYDVVLRGHTHKLRIEEIGKSLVVNPGEVCGYLTDERTFVIYETETHETEKVYM